MAFSIGELSASIGFDDRAFKAGLARTQAGIRQLDGNIKSTSQGASLNVNKLSNAFQALAIQATGVNPAIARVGSVLSSFAVGGAVTAGVLLGLAALSKAWDHFTAEAKKAREETQRLIDKYKEAAALRAAGGQGQLDKQQLERDRMGLVPKITDAQDRLRGAAEGSRDAFAASVELETLKKRFNELGTAINSVTAEIEAGAPAFGGIAGPGGDPIPSAQDIAERMARRLTGADPEAGGIVDDFMGRTFARGGGAANIDAGPANFGTADSGFAGSATGVAPQQSTLSKAGGALKDFGGAVLGILSALNPWQILLDAIGRALGDFLVNMTPIIEILAAALMPILKALFPVFKLLAVAATYVGQVFFTMIGLVAKAWGNLIKGLGKFLDAIPFLGDFGLIKAGNALIDLGNGFGEASSELGKARKDINDLEWKDALDPLTEAANETAGALRNVPEGFKIALHTFQATTGVAMGGLGGKFGATSVAHYGDVYIDAQSQPAAEVYQAWLREQARQQARGGGGGYESRGEG